jgi:hypothetical protein
VETIRESSKRLMEGTYIYFAQRWSVALLTKKRFYKSAKAFNKVSVAFARNPKDM